MEKKVRVRFAPSPTGHLHIGNFRTGIFNWLFARHHKGDFLLRIEDTDAVRYKPEYVESIERCLKWAGIESDESPVVQSERLDDYKIIIAKLLQEKKAYKCYCTPEEIEIRLKKGDATQDFYVHYDGFCRQFIGNEQNKPYVVRFALPSGLKEVAFDDLIRGRVVFPIDQLDDFIIARTNGNPIYNFVVVVDDAFMNITHVIRGEDHISNTPKQILLYEACGYDVPQFAHLPLILGSAGEKLSKRDAATSVVEYMQDGYLPDALINYLVRLGWAHGDQEIFTREELINFFTLKAVGKKGSIFDVEKLNWVNSIYIKQQEPLQLLKYIAEYVRPDIEPRLRDWDEVKIAKFIALYIERVQTLHELADLLEHLYDGPKIFDRDSLQKWITPETSTQIIKIIAALQGCSPFTVESIQSTLKTLAKEFGVKLVSIAQPIRIALIGSDSGPGVFVLLQEIGKEDSINRIQTLRDTIDQMNW